MINASKFECGANFSLANKIDGVYFIWSTLLHGLSLSSIIVPAFAVELRRVHRVNGFEALNVRIHSDIHLFWVSNLFLVEVAAWKIRVTLQKCLAHVAAQTVGRFCVHFSLLASVTMLRSFSTARRRDGRVAVGLSDIDGHEFNPHDIINLSINSKIMRPKNMWCRIERATAIVHKIKFITLPAFNHACTPPNQVFYCSAGTQSRSSGDEESAYERYGGIKFQASNNLRRGSSI